MTSIKSKHTQKLNDFEKLNKKNPSQAKCEEILYLMNTKNILWQYHKEETVKNNSISLSELLNMSSKFPSPSNKKNDLYKKYIETNNEYVETRENLMNDEILCTNCTGKETIFNNTDSLYYCADCGHIFPVIFDSSKFLISSDIVKETSQTSTKRKAHLSDWLITIQGHRHVDIPDKVYSAIYEDLKKMRITDADRNILKKESITNELLRTILKKRAIGKYYDDIPYIKSQITGESSAFLSPIIETKLKNLFDLMQQSYEKHRKTSSGGQLTSYSFIIRKLLELLGEKEHAKRFKLVSNKTKLSDYNNAWKKICNDLNWQYVPS